MFALLIIVFGLVRFTGDPTYFLLPPDPTAAQRAELRHELGLDKPIPVQFGYYLRDVSHGDLGMSYVEEVPVTQLIGDRIGATLEMGLAALLVLLLAVPLGIYGAYWEGGWLDKFSRTLAALGQSVPNFWLGLLLILVFAVHFGWLPSGGDTGLKSLVLPAFTLAFSGMAGLIRLLRSSTLEVLSSDYVKFLRIKGTSESRILWVHALRNAGLTALGFSAIIMVGLFTGSVLVETVFVWPGIGRLLSESIASRDYNVVQGVIILIGGAYIVTSFVVDVLYIFLNPRLRVASASAGSR
jgi:peptide/nickel transport system permease protein